MTGFVPPPYPYDRLDELATIADAFPGGVIDLSIGTPGDPPPPEVVSVLASSDAERGYPPSVGSPRFRTAASDWLERRFGVRVAAEHIGACVGTKELVVGVPPVLRLRDPERDTVLFPAISYPSYAMGATLAGLRAVPVPVDAQWRLDLDAIDPADIGRALCLWVNTPGNPAGGLDDLGRVAAWGRANGVTVFSDECYIEFTWDAPHGSAPTGQPGRSILEHGSDGVVAVHSLSKRSNLAGLRTGFFAGDTELVHYLREVRKHQGRMVPGPVQAAAAVALADDAHVDAQRRRYRDRLELMIDICGRFGVDATMPGGGFYLWVPAPSGDAWAFAKELATRVGVLVSPGEFYGPGGTGHVRIAVVQPDDRLELVVERLASGG